MAFIVEVMCKSLNLAERICFEAVGLGRLENRLTDCELIHLLIRDTESFVELTALLVSSEPALELGVSRGARPLLLRALL